MRKSASPVRREGERSTPLSLSLRLLPLLQRMEERVGQRRGFDAWVRSRLSLRAFPHSFLAGRGFAEPEFAF